MADTKRTYGVTSDSYLGRAAQRIREETPEGLIYAALELRAGTEARLQEYLDPQPHVSEKRKRTYRISLLGKSADLISIDDKAVECEVRSESGEILARLLYTPVRENLKQIAQRLGDYLHAIGETKASSAEWWQELEQLVNETFEELLWANVGELLGSPIVDGGSGMRVHAVLESGLAEASKKWKGRRMMIEIRHLEEIPHELIEDLRKRLL